MFTNLWLFGNANLGTRGAPVLIWNIGQIFPETAGENRLFKGEFKKNRR
jgi:hypothetical protein